jgi:hypothetical protein
MITIISILATLSAVFGVGSIVIMFFMWCAYALQKVAE